MKLTEHPMWFLWTMTIMSLFVACIWGYILIVGGTGQPIRVLTFVTFTLLTLVYGFLLVRARSKKSSD